MDNAEKLKHIEEFNELAQNGDWSEAIGMIIADFDVSLFNIPSRKKFIQYCNSAISEDTNITPSQMSNIMSSIKMLKILTERLINNSSDSSNKHDDKATYDYAQVSMEPHIRIGYGITDMFNSEGKMVDNIQRGYHGKDALLKHALKYDLGKEYYIDQIVLHNRWWEGSWNKVSVTARMNGTTIELYDANNNRLRTIQTGNWHNIYSKEYLL
jgi:hypothetical protein